jgi:hypothetical protein
LKKESDAPEEADDDTPMGELIVRWMEGQSLGARLAFLDEITAVFCPACGRFHPEDEIICMCESGG